VAAAILPMLKAAGTARATTNPVIVEQIEAYEDATNPKTHYAPVDFGGNTTVAGSGIFSGITFHAIDGTTNTLSNHANTVGSLIYGTGATGNGAVNNVYAAAADIFLANTVNGQAVVSSSGPLPGHFATGAQIINNSWVTSDTSNLDDQRRVDFMINRDDVTFVAAAADTGLLAGNYLVWSSFNSLAVRGDQDNFDPTGSPGKTHADLLLTGHASFTAATVSGYAAGLYGQAPSAAQHGVVMRSLLMAGADKSNYSRDTANNLSIQSGAGVPNYNTSLAILNAGQQTFSLASGSGTGSTVAATATMNTKGWSFGTITNNTVDAIVFHLTNSVNTITASLNWNVTSNSTGSTIDTTNGGLIFPDLALDLKPVTFSGGHYVIGSTADTTFHSNAANDNVEYLYSTSGLAPGDYAFIISGDATRSTSVGFSYSLVGPPVSTWNLSTGSTWGTPGNWIGGVPNSQTARANFLSSPGITTAATVTLDGSRTVGQMTFDNSQSYTIAPGSGGTLTIDDTGDGAGGGGPLITVNTGSHTISAPVSLVGGLTVNTASSTSLTISNNITGSGGLTKTGSGSLTLSGSTYNYGNSNLNAGTFTLAAGSSLASANISVAGATFNANGSLTGTPTMNVGSIVNLGANPNSGILNRNFTAVTFGGSAIVNVVAAAVHANRTLLSTSQLLFTGSSGSWSGKLDLSNNDMIVHGGSLSDVISQLKAGINIGNAPWTGTSGITSSTAAADGAHLTALGVIQNNDGTGHVIYGSGTFYGTFDGQSPALNDILVKYTYYGDTDLNGVVDGGDYARIDNAFNLHLTGANAGWVNGDFNYDGVVDGADYALMDNVFNMQGSLTPLAVTAVPASSSASAASVPEPTSGAIVIGLLCLTGGWRLRNRRARGPLETASVL
jgi:hypothetical protein